MVNLPGFFIKRRAMPFDWPCPKCKRKIGWASKGDVDRGWCSTVDAAFISGGLWVLTEGKV